MKKLLLICAGIAFGSSFASAGGIIPVVTGSIAETYTAVDYYNQSLAELNYGNNAAAMEKMNKAIELKSDYADALSYRGYFHHLAKEYDLAITDYLAADKLKHNINGYFIASSYAKAGKKEEAFKWLEVSLTIAENKALLNSIINDPDLESLKGEAKWKEIVAKDWYTPYEKIIAAGNAKMEQKDLAGAMVEWNKAIALEPANDIAYGKRGLNYIYEENYDKALTEINEAIRLKASSVYYGNRAYIYKKQKKFKEALADYDKAIELDPQNIVQGDMAMVKFTVDQTDPSIATDLKKYLSYYYKDDFNFYFLGIYYYGVNNFMESANTLNKAIALKNDEPDYYVKRAQAYFGLKFLSQAEDDCTKAINLRADNGAAYYLRGTINGEQVKKAEACADWKKALELGYEDVNGYYKSICK
ncbi:MAG: hypothetical protein K0S33_3922 [Bacteroidetes bacterium]|jgi:tetratricopeptide (TPR) repeat protein|nr:hypothetical protein [Bacteroidota bacterium]